MDAAAGPGAIEREGFLAAMRRAAATITVVGTAGPEGRLGLIVSAMCSVSADPQSPHVGIHSGSPVAAVITRNGCFAVNLLAESQCEISETFAGRRTHAAIISRRPPGAIWRPARQRSMRPRPSSTAGLPPGRRSGLNISSLVLSLRSMMASADRLYIMIAHDRRYCALIPQGQAPDFPEGEATLGALVWGL